MPVHKRVRDDVDRLFATKPEETRYDGRGRDFDEDDVIEADAVEGVEEREATLDLVRLDHALEQVAHGELGLARACEVIGDSEDGAEVVGWMTPWMSYVSEITMWRLWDNAHSAARKQSL